MYFVNPAPISCIVEAKPNSAEQGSPRKATAIPPRLHATAQSSHPTRGGKQICPTHSVLSFWQEEVSENLILAIRVITEVLDRSEAPLTRRVPKSVFSSAQHWLVQVHSLKLNLSPQKLELETFFSCKGLKAESLMLRSV